MSEWKIPTLADTGVEDSVRCRCRRIRRPMQMLNMDGVEAAKGAKYLCTTCIESLYQTDKLDRIELHRAKGAPAEWLEWWEAKLLDGPVQRTGLPPHIWGEIKARALDAAIAKEEAKVAAEAAKEITDG